MTITLFAQPYDIHANGFYFETAKQYRAKQAQLTNEFGDPVEEFEIQFIDGDGLDAELAKAIGLNQANFADFLECAENWEDWQKIKAIIAYGELGYVFDPDTDPDGYDIDLYHFRNLIELAEHFVEEGLYGDVPEPLRFYINYEAIGYELAMEYSETTIDGEAVIYRAA